MSESSSLPPAAVPSAGAHIGHYRIVSFLGAGGMGEVYRAHDARLGRDVALKILPVEGGADADRIRRFALEAQTTGRINHPNVVSVFDAGEWEGRPYIVTELLEGETLRAHVQSSGPLPIRKVVELAIQIARGLASAHERGIVHRDLKPANIFITNDGHLKILDFGLAKLRRPDWESSARDVDTISLLSTPGAVLGSAGYMSPEQVEARVVDHRSDLFSFGVILYELLTGQRPFTGSSPVATMSAILKDTPPDVVTLRPDVPHALVAIVRRCLEKRADDRYQSARDLAFTLEELSSRSDVTFSSAALAAIRSAAVGVRRRPLLSVTALLATISAALLVSVLDSRSAGVGDPKSVTPSPVTWQIERLTTSGLAGDYIAVSPDENYVAYDAGEGLFLIHVPSRSTTNIVKAKAGEVYSPRFSPDGNLVYFGRWTADDRRSLYRVPLLGGDPQLVTGSFGKDLTFARDGGRLAFLRDDESKNESALVAMAADGSNERVVATRPYRSGNFVECSWAPDGARFLCAALHEEKVAMLEVDAVTGAQKLLPKAKFLVSLDWFPDGSAFLGIDRTPPTQIWRVSYPALEATRVTGDLSSYRWMSLGGKGKTIAAIRIDVTTNLWAVSVADGALRQITTGMNTYDGNWGIAVTPDGRIVWASRASGTGTNLMISDLDGSNRKQLTFGDTLDWWPHLSPDGRVVIFQRGTGGGPDLWRMNIDGTNPVRLTKGRQGYFTADGRSILFTRDIDDVPYLFEMPAEGGEPRQRDPKPIAAIKPSPDGRWLLVAAGNHSELRPASGPGPGRALPDVPGVHRAWRPDSRAIAFLNRLGDGLNLFVKELNGTPPRQVTHLEGGEYVAFGFDWAPDGKEIVFARRSQARDVVVLKASP